MLHFRFVSGDTNWMDYGGTFLSKPLTNGEFTYYLALIVTNWVDAVGRKEAHERGVTYNVELVSVSPEQARPTQAMAEARKSCGYDSTEALSPLQEVDALLSCGVYAPLWSEEGNNIRSLLKRGREKAETVTLLYGLFMARRVNLIGTTGWQAQRGEL